MRFRIAVLKFSRTVRLGCSKFVSKLLGNKLKKLRDEMIFNRNWMCIFRSPRPVDFRILHSFALGGDSTSHANCLKSYEHINTLVSACS